MRTLVMAGFPLVLLGSAAVSKPGGPTHASNPCLSAAPTNGIEARDFVATPSATDNIIKLTVQGCVVTRIPMPEQVGNDFVIFTKQGRFLDSQGTQRSVMAGPEPSTWRVMAAIQGLNLDRERLSNVMQCGLLFISWVDSEGRHSRGVFVPFRVGDSPAPEQC